MFLSKIEVAQGRFKEAVFALRDHEIYAEHSMIWKLFPDDSDATRDFLYRKDDSGGLPFYYLLSQRKPEATLDYLNVTTTSFSPKLKKGDHLHFSLRANAVITRKPDDGSSRRIRRDIVDAKIDEYRTKEPDSSQWPPSAQIHHEAGVEWLGKRGENLGFAINDLSVANHQYHQFKKPQDVKDRNERRFTSLDFVGALQVTDPQIFLEQALFQGIGRAKAYGCGLMLVRRL